MKTIKWLSLLAATPMVCAVACDTGTAAIDQDASSCEGTTFYRDANDRCHRKDNGRFAASVCCEAPPEPVVPTERRSLATYTCPDEVSSIPVAFFDADSTLRVAKSGSPSANSSEDVFVLPFAAEKIAELRDQGFLIAVVSNQGGVAAGFIELETAEAALAYTISQLDALGGATDYFDFAEAKDENRKPNTGMADRLVEQLADRCDATIDWDASFMVGDAGYKKNVDDAHPWNDRPADDFSNSDRGLAENLGIPFYEPAQAEAFGWDAYGFYNVHRPSELFEFYEQLELRATELRDDGNDEAADALTEIYSAGRAINGL